MELLEYKDIEKTLENECETSFLNFLMGCDSELIENIFTKQKPAKTFL